MKDRFSNKNIERIKRTSREIHTDDSYPNKALDNAEAREKINSVRKSPSLGKFFEEKPADNTETINDGQLPQKSM